MFHLFLTFFLLIEELALASDISSIELRGDIFAKGGYILSCDDIIAHDCLDRDRELCFRDIFLELCTYPSTEIPCPTAVCHHGKCIDDISCDADIHLHDIILMESDRFIVEARIATRETLQIIIIVTHEFTHRDLIVEDDTTSIEVGLVAKYSPPLLREIHEISDVLIRRDHLDLGDRFFDMDIGSRLREIIRIRYREIGTLSSFSLDEFSSRTRIFCDFITIYEHLVRHLRTRDDHVHIMLSPEALLHDIEMEQSEESTAKSISECG